MCSSFARTSRTSTLYVPPESSNSLANDANVAPPSLIGASERVPPRRVPDDVFLEETSEDVHVAGGEGGVDRLEGGEIRMLSQRTSCSTRALYAAASARSPRPTSRRRARHDASLGTLFTVCGVVLVERAVICWPNVSVSGPRVQQQQADCRHFVDARLRATRTNPHRYASTRMRA